MSDLYLCACEQFYKAHGPDCPAKRQFDDLKVKLAEAERAIDEVNVGMKDGAPVIWIQSKPGYYMSVREAIDAAKKDEEHGKL